MPLIITRTEKIRFKPNLFILFTNEVQNYNIKLMYVDDTVLVLVRPTTNLK